MPENEMNKLYLTNPDLVIREEDENGALVFNPDTNDVKIINHTGISILNICSQKIAVSDIVNELNEQHDIQEGTDVETDVKNFLDEMIATGFIGLAEQ